MSEVLSFSLSLPLFHFFLCTVPGIRYIRPGAEKEINVSDRIRNKILTTEVTRCVTTKILALRVRRRLGFVFVEQGDVVGVFETVRMTLLAQVCTGTRLCCGLIGRQFTSKDELKLLLTLTFSCFPFTSFSLTVTTCSKRPCQRWWS